MLGRAVDRSYTESPPLAEEPDVAELGFEGALRKVAEAVERLESGELELDEALGRYQEGVKLLAHCYHLLDGAERTVALLTGVDPAGNPVTAPFDATATADREPPATCGEPEPSAPARTPRPRRSPPTNPGSMPA